MILIPIMGAVNCFIGRNKKEHKEINIFIETDEKNIFYGKNKYSRTPKRLP